MKKELKPNDDEASSSKGKMPIIFCGLLLNPFLFFVQSFFFRQNVVWCPRFDLRLFSVKIVCSIHSS